MNKLRRKLLTITNVDNAIIENYLTIVALEDNLTTSLSSNSCEYCIDGSGDWQVLNAGELTSVINEGQSLSFRANITPITNSSLYYGIGTFTVSKMYKLKGNIMSMLFGDEGKNSYSLAGKTDAFRRLFNNSSTLVSAKDLKLPATTLSDLCYLRMFANCTSLVDSPALPAMDLKDNCYGSMFIGCKSLKSPPELPAMSLNSLCYAAMFSGCSSLEVAPDLSAKYLYKYCYYQMFYNCTSLKYIKMLATNTNASSCLSNWVLGVASNGTFVKSSSMTNLSYGVSGIPFGWNVEDVII